MATKKADPTDCMIAVLERIETELRGLKTEAKETNERLGRLETQGKLTNKRLGNLEVRLTSVEVPAMASIEAARPASRGGRLQDGRGVDAALLRPCYLARSRRARTARGESAPLKT